MPPVLLLVFNRPAVVRQLVSAIRPHRPRRVYVAADGPRTSRPDDAARCAEVRSEVARGVDWPCDLQMLYRETNVGLQDAVVSGIDWFFSHEAAGVILEDDCVPAPDFLAFSREMLDRYADAPEVMHISGASMSRGAPTAGTPSYHFAQAGHVWGWATWRCAWQQFEPTFSEWPSVRAAYRRDPVPLRRALAAKFASAHAGRKWTWSRAWHWSMLQHRGLSVVPSVNLIHNVGDGDDATHQHGAAHPLRHPHGDALVWPLIHPTAVVTDPQYDAMLTRYHQGTWVRRLSDSWWTMREAFA